MTDLLWSDPSSNSGWNPNIGRGIGYHFGVDISQQFTHHNGLKMIARAHQLMMNGYEKIHDNKVLTLFSAPNYCYRCGNQAAMLDLDENLNSSLITYDHAPDHNTANITEKRVPDYFLWFVFLQIYLTPYINYRTWKRFQQKFRSLLPKQSSK